MPNEKRSAFSSRQLSVAILSVAAAALVVAAGLAWWRGPALDPQRVFWGMLANNLATPGVTLHESSTANGTTTAQTNQFEFGPHARAQSVTTFTRGAAKVQTLELSAPGADYTKYTTIKTGSAQPAGRFNLSTVLNVWANTTGTSKDAHVPSTFGTVLLGLALPFGDLQQNDRAALLNEMQTRQVYTTSFQQLKKQHAGGRLQYVYTVTMQPILYVQLMKDYAHDMGMHELDSVDPNSYSGAAPTAMQWTVDARSRQLVRVAYDGHTETYSGYGLRIATPLPTKTITGAELQRRVNVLNAHIQG